MSIFIIGNFLSGVYLWNLPIYVWSLWLEQKGTLPQAKDGKCWSDLEASIEQGMSVNDSIIRGA